MWEEEVKYTRVSSTEQNLLTFTSLILLFQVFIHLQVDCTSSILKFLQKQSHYMMSPSVTWVLFIFSSVVHGQEVFNTLPPPVMSSFTCRGRDTGFYADIEANCRVYHTCDDHGNKFTYNCPLDTAFRQDSLVCDHAYRVDCQKSAELILQRPEDSPAKSDDVQDSSTFSRSFRISPQPSIYLLAPKSSDEKPTTFVMSSTMFFRDQSNFQNNNRRSKSQKLIQKHFSPTSTPSTTTTTTKRYFANFQFKNPTKPFAVLEKPKNFLSENNSSAAERSQNNGQKFVKSQFVNNNNYPYIETLRSMQNNTNKNYFSTTLRTTTAGTEFPIPKFGDTLSGLNSEDPYYPRHANTEKSYSLSTKNKQQKFFAFTTPRSSVNNVAFEIPDSLPDLNSVEDLVDRRKLLFIPPPKNFKRN